MVSIGCPNRAPRSVSRCLLTMDRRPLRNLTLLLSCVIYSLPLHSVFWYLYLPPYLLRIVSTLAPPNLSAEHASTRGSERATACRILHEPHYAVTLLAALVLSELSTYYKRRSMPSGPFRWPLIGNALQVPQVHPWLTYSRWA